MPSGIGDYFGMLARRLSSAAETLRGLNVSNSNMSQSGLPEVNVVSTLNRLDSEEDSTDEETLSVKEPSLSISQLGEGDSEQIATSHPRLVKALSEVPYSPLFGFLWPIIIEQASFETRAVFRKVNSYFERLCKPYRDSDLAKDVKFMHSQSHDIILMPYFQKNYVIYFGSRKQREELPFILELSFDAEWRSWGAVTCGFKSVGAFRAFCALGDIDPDEGRRWSPGAYKLIQLGFLPAPPSRSIWLSRTKDIVFETLLDPLVNGDCHLIGLTGVANKAVAMYNFMHDKYDDSVEAPAMTTKWSRMGWDREFI